jgi:SAM-dependent methyltransferase/uncharacterized protein YbaR (Trm112 family)
MLISDLDYLTCPGCFSTLQLERQEGEREPVPPGLEADRMAWEGRLICSGCEAWFPVMEGVACLTRLNDQWKIPIKEMENRLSLTLRTMEPEPWEEDRAEAYERQEKSCFGFMDHLFNSAMNELDLSDQPLVLDVGAGACRTTREFIHRGVRAIGLDVDIGQLRYISYCGIDPKQGEKWVHPVSGQEFHHKESEQFDQYFSRVFANIERLPFANGLFDIVFCRAVLHHLDHHENTMREMTRVLKPGGRLLFCSEPIRSPLEDEEDSWDGCVQREEGMNERVWPLRRFTAPIRDVVEDIMVQTWPNSPTRSLKSRLPFLGGWLSRRIGQGARVKGWKLGALHLVNASVNIFARRNGVTMPHPQAESIDRDDSLRLQELVELFRVRPGEIEDGVRDVARKRSVVNRIRRDLLRHDTTLPTEVHPASTGVYQLDRGWLNPLKIRDRRGRKIGREAACSLRVPPGAGRLVLRLYLDPETGGRLGLWMNDKLAGWNRWEMPETGGWQELKYELGNNQGCIVSIRLRVESDPAKACQDHDGSRGKLPVVVVEYIGID